MKNIILIILLSICFSLSESKTLSLQGTVFGDDGSVIAGATVFARPCGIADSVAYGNASDGNGRYQLQLPACDSLRLSVTYIGYERHEELLTNLAENAEHDIVLNRSTVERGEVTVERDNTVIKEDVLQFYPDRKQAQASSNATELLDRLMIPNINIDRSSWKVSTATGEDVAILIDGREASADELNTLRPKDVLRVEYVSRPAGRYSDRAAYVNYILKKYEYGGYVYARADQSFICNSGEYLLSAKINHGKWTYQIDVSDWLFNSEQEGVKKEWFSLMNDNSDFYDLRRETVMGNDRRYNTFTGAASVTYSDSTNYFYANANFRTQNTAIYDEWGNITYVPSKGLDSRYTSGKSGIINMPTLKAKYEKKLPRNQILTVEGSFNYTFGDNDNNYDETGDNPYSYVKNGDINNFSYNVNGTYLLPLKKGNALNLILSTQGATTKIDYTGTYPEEQKVSGFFVIAGAYYMHRFNDKWRLNVGGYGALTNYDTGINTKTELMPVTMAALSYNINKTNILQAYCNIGIFSQGGYRNDIIQPIDGLMYNMGNSGIKNGYDISAQLSYTGIIGNLSLMPYIQYQSSSNALPYAWIPGKNAIYQTQVNSGTFNRAILGIAPKLNLLGGKLSFSGTFLVARENKSRLYSRTLHPYSGSLQAYLYVGNFSFFASYRTYSKHMTNYGTYDNQSFDDWWLEATYSNANLSVKAGVRNLFEKKHIHTWVDAPYYTSDDRYTMTDFSQRVYVTLTYTLDFGRQIKHTSPQSSGGLINTQMM